MTLVGLLRCLVMLSIPLQLKPFATVRSMSEGRVLQRPPPHRSGFLGAASYALVVQSPPGRGGAPHLHLAAGGALVADLDAPSMAALVAIVRGNLYEPSLYPGAAGLWSSPPKPPTRTAFDPHFKFGPPAGKPASFVFTASAPVVVVRTINPNSKPFVQAAGAASPSHSSSRRPRPGGGSPCSHMSHISNPLQALGRPSGRLAVYCAAGPARLDATTKCNTSHAGAFLAMHSTAVCSVESQDALTAADPAGDRGGRAVRLGSRAAAGGARGAAALRAGEPASALPMPCM